MGRSGSPCCTVRQQRVRGAALGAGSAGADEAAAVEAGGAGPPHARERGEALEMVGLVRRADGCRLLKKQRI